MILSDFTFFYDTPFNNMGATLHFKSNEERDNYFLEKLPYRTKKFDNKTSFNFMRDRGTLRIPTKPGDIEKLQGINYCTWIDDTEYIRWYGYVSSVRYVNDGTAEMDILPDGIMTFCQGKALENLEGLTIDRQHFTKKKYESMLTELKNNDDILATYTKSYSFENVMKFGDYVAIILSASDLTSDFGDEDHPKMKSSRGGKRDEIISPLSLYMVEESDFVSFQTQLAEYPWIAQNIKSVIMIPKDFFNDSDFEPVSDNFNFGRLNRLTDNRVVNGETEEIKNKLNDFSLTTKELYEMFNIKEEEKHLLRNGYFTCEIYTWDGQSLSVDLGQLSEEDGLKFRCNSVLGYENEVAFYIQNYKRPTNKRPHTDKPLSIIPSQMGSYLNDAIILKSFDSAPMIIDQKGLNLANNAYTRARESRQHIIGASQALMSDNTSASEKIEGALSMVNFFTGGFRGLIGSVGDQINYYANLRATKKDMDLIPRTITEQTNSFALQRANDNFGLTMKIGSMDEEEFKRIKKYYKWFGFQYQRVGEKLESITSMSNINFVKFTGFTRMKGCPQYIADIMDAIFETGLALWHYDGSQNFKFSEDKILTNKIVE